MKTVIMNKLTVPADFDDQIGISELRTQMQAMKSLEQNMLNYQRAFLKSKLHSFNELFDLIPKKDLTQYFTERKELLQKYKYLDEGQTYNYCKNNLKNVHFINKSDTYRDFSQFNKICIRKIANKRELLHTSNFLAVVDDDDITNIIVLKSHFNFSKTEIENMARAWRESPLYWNKIWRVDDDVKVTYPLSLSFITNSYTKEYIAIKERKVSNINVIHVGTECITKYIVKNVADKYKFIIDHVNKKIIWFKESWINSVQFEETNGSLKCYLDIFNLEPNIILEWEITKNNKKMDSKTKLNYYPHNEITLLFNTESGNLIETLTK